LLWINTSEHRKCPIIKVFHTKFWQICKTIYGTYGYSILSTFSYMQYKGESTVLEEKNLIWTVDGFMPLQSHWIQKLVLQYCVRAHACACMYVCMYVCMDACICPLVSIWMVRFYSHPVPNSLSILDQYQCICRF
jgi:hypothetical protein